MNSENVTYPLQDKVTKMAASATDPVQNGDPLHIIMVQPLFLKVKLPALGILTQAIGTSNK